MGAAAIFGALHVKPKLPNEATKYLKTKDFRFWKSQIEATARIASRAPERRAKDLGRHGFQCQLCKNKPTPGN
jgi:hypothetical protein